MTLRLVSGREQRRPCKLEMGITSMSSTVCCHSQRIPGWLIWMHWIDPINYSVSPTPLLLPLSGVHISFALQSQICSHLLAMLGCSAHAQQKACRVLRELLIGTA